MSGSARIADPRESLGSPPPTSSSVASAASTRSKRIELLVEPCALLGRGPAWSSSWSGAGRAAADSPACLRGRRVGAGDLTGFLESPARILPMLTSTLPAPARRAPALNARGHGAGCGRATACTATRDLVVQRGPALSSISHCNLIPSAALGTACPLLIICPLTKVHAVSRVSLSPPGVFICLPPMCWAPAAGSPTRSTSIVNPTGLRCPSTPSTSPAKPGQDFRDDLVVYTSAPAAVRTVPSKSRRPGRAASVISRTLLQHLARAVGPLEPERSRRAGEWTRGGGHRGSVQWARGLI